MAGKRRHFKDLNLSMVVHPNTKDLVYLKDEDAIKRALKNLVLTNIYERHFDDTFGCQATGLLFEDVSIFTAVSIQSTIESAISYYEPRVNLISVDVAPNEDEHGYEISITFQIKNSVQPITISMFLERVR